MGQIFFEKRKEQTMHARKSANVGYLEKNNLGKNWLTSDVKGDKRGRNRNQQKWGKEREN